MAAVDRPRSGEPWPRQYAAAILRARTPHARATAEAAVPERFRDWVLHYLADWRARQPGRSRQEDLTPWHD